VPPSLFRGRPSFTSYEYDADGRVARTVTSSPWTTEDRALMLALAEHKKTLCPGCGHPKATAWHWDNDGYFAEDQRVVCHACTAMKVPDKGGQVEPEVYRSVVDTRDYKAEPLPLFDPTGEG